MQVERGDVYIVDFDPVTGRELGRKRRPAVVVSINDINRKPLVISVVPGTTNCGEFRNVAIVEPAPWNGLQSSTAFQCHQLRAIDQSRLRSAKIGRLSVGEMKRVERAVAYSLGLISP